jgi:hypothetical protein
MSECSFFIFFPRSLAILINPKDAVKKKIMLLYMMRGYLKKEKAKNIAAKAQNQRIAI